MRTLRRLKFMSSPSLSDLGKREPAAASADERGTQQRRACANATWNSIHNGVIAVFQRKGLPDQELFSLNEGVRQLLKTELGSFFTEYLQNQLLTKGMVILRDKIRFYEGQKLLDSLAETWDFFFSDVLPTLQAIFYPVQGKEPSVRQLALLHFRNAITLSVKLEDALARAHARVPPAIVQMLLVLQGVHESRGVTKDYLRLETLVQKVVSPYLGTYGLYSGEGSFTHSCRSTCCAAPARGTSWPRTRRGPAPADCTPRRSPRSPGPPAAPRPSSSPENLVDRILESVDSDSEGIFIDFGRRSGSGASEFEGARGRQSIVRSRVSLGPCSISLFVGKTIAAPPLPRPQCHSVLGCLHPGFTCLLQVTRCTGQPQVRGLGITTHSTQHATPTPTETVTPATWPGPGMALGPTCHPPLPTAHPVGDCPRPWAPPALTCRGQDAGGIKRIQLHGGEGFKRNLGDTVHSVALWWVTGPFVSQRDPQARSGSQGSPWSRSPAGSLEPPTHAPPPSSPVESPEVGFGAVLPGGLRPRNRWGERGGFPPGGEPPRKGGLGEKG
ncbi:hypothetical protein QTO34_012894 [Cnephaeus nilssonii]|uniref:Proline-rich protein 5 n=1 Tax=Cnephaeus nilssonii TaxID=3371016 RepID=A0AA40HBC3_CNENI|nr:hypothetical protein QTO34_012894 [Eptesicus nilssonii]